jgi:hypothetical protein
MNRIDNRHEAIQKLAYELWEERGSPIGSPETDWFNAEQQFGHASRSWHLRETIGESYGETHTETVADNELHIASVTMGSSTDESRSRATTAAL